MTPEGHAAVKQVLNSLDHIAFLTQAGWIPEEMIMPWMNPMVVKAWARLAPYVEYESRKRREPDYYQHARELAERCREWRKRNVPNAEIAWIKMRCKARGNGVHAGHDHLPDSASSSIGCSTAMTRARRCATRSTYASSKASSGIVS